MPNLINTVPKYRRHKATNQAVVTLSGTDHYLGRWQSKASRVAYEALIVRWLASGRRSLDSTDADVTIAELCAHYWQHVKRYYVKRGVPTSEQACIKASLRPLLRLYKDDRAAEFGPLALVVVRDAMIDTPHGCQSAFERY